MASVSGFLQFAFSSISIHYFPIRVYREGFFQDSPGLFVILPSMRAINDRPCAYVSFKRFRAKAHKKLPETFVSGSFLSLT